MYVKEHSLPHELVQLDNDAKYLSGHVWHMEVRILGLDSWPTLPTNPTLGRTCYLSRTSGEGRSSWLDLLRKRLLFSI